MTTWYDASLGRNRAVPWDPFLLNRIEMFLQALAEHTIDGTPLSDHPVLEVANFGLVGAKLAIRDPDTVKLRDMPGYSRTALTDAVLRNLRAATTNFPTKFIQIGFWPVADATASPSLHEDLRQAILAEFNGVTRPRQSLNSPPASRTTGTSAAASHGDIKLSTMSSARPVATSR